MQREGPLVILTQAQFYSLVYNDIPRLVEVCTNEWRLIQPPDECPRCVLLNEKNNVKVGSNVTMKNQNGKMYPYYRCQQKARHWISVTQGSPFRLTTLRLSDALELFWMFCVKTSVRKTARITGRGTTTVQKFFRYSRQNMARAAVDLFKTFRMGEEEGDIIQIDESLFEGRRKYNKGRLRLGDQTLPRTEFQKGETPTRARIASLRRRTVGTPTLIVRDPTVPPSSLSMVDDEDEIENVLNDVDDDADIDYSPENAETSDDDDEGELDPNRHENFENPQESWFEPRSPRRWVFGIALLRRTETGRLRVIETRFFAVQSRARDTLLPIIFDNVAPSTLR